MSDERVLQVQAWYDAWNARDFGLLRTMYNPAAAYLRPDGFSQGADAITAYLQAVAAELPNESAIVDAVVCGPDVAAVEWRAQSSSHDGQPRARMASFFRFQDDKILSQHEFGDPARSVRLLAARLDQVTTPSAIGSPGETMVAAPAPIVAMPAAPSAPSGQPEAGPAASAPPAAAQLCIEAGPDHGLVISIEGPAVVLGRALDNDFRLQDPCTSGHHARLESQDGRVVLVDLGSTNGTYVNGLQVDRSELHDGDRITIGGNVGRFVEPTEVTPAQTSIQPISA